MPAARTLLLVTSILACGDPGSRQTHVIGVQVEEHADQHALQAVADPRSYRLLEIRAVGERFELWDRLYVNGSGGPAVRIDPENGSHDRRLSFASAKDLAAALARISAEERRYGADLHTVQLVPSGRQTLAEIATLLATLREAVTFSPVTLLVDCVGCNEPS